MRPSVRGIVRSALAEALRFWGAMEGGGPIAGFCGQSDWKAGASGGKPPCERLAVRSPVSSGFRGVSTSEAECCCRSCKRSRSARTGYLPRWADELTAEHARLPASAGLITGRISCVARV
jgi:hypothetical protein